jgi:hypothetical protein
MGDALGGLELRASEEQVLSEHVHDLPGRVVLQSTTKTSLSVATRHPDIEKFVVVKDRVDASLIRNAEPVNAREGNRCAETRKWRQDVGHSKLFMSGGEWRA